MIGLSLAGSVLQSNSAAIVSHNKVLIDDVSGRWSSRDLADIARIGLDVREGLATLADSVEDESDRCRSDGVVGKRICFKLIAFDMSNCPAVECRSLAEIVHD